MNVCENRVLSGMFWLEGYKLIEEWIDYIMRGLMICTANQINFR